MPGPETAFRPGPEAHTKSHDQFTMPDVTSPEEQQLVPFSQEDLDVKVPDDASMLDPMTGELLHPPDKADALDPITGEPLTDVNNTGGPTKTHERELPPTPPFRVVIAGLDQNIEQMAREAALEKLEAEKVRKGPLWKHITKRVWHTLTHEYQLVKATKKAKEEIIANDNLRHHQGKSDERWREATTERMASEYGEKLMHEGETYHKINAEAENDPNTPEGRMRIDTLNLLRRHAKGEFLDKASFEEAFNEQINQWRQAGIAQELIGEGRLKASNMFAVGEQIKAALDSTDGLDALDRELYLESILAKTELVVGEAKVGSNVEIKATTSERLAEKLRKVPFVSEERLAGVASFLGNEVFMAGVLSVAVALGKKGGSFIPGLGAAVVAGFRERRDILNQRALADRREDNDQTVDATNKRQEKIDETRYETRSASELLDQLSKLYNEQGELNIKTREDLEQAIKTQAEIKARLDLHFGQGARLINFADVSSDAMEEQKFDLELAMAKLEIDMQKLYDNPIAVGVLDIKPDESFKDMLQTQTDIEIGALKGGMDKQDKLLNKLIIKQVLKKSVLTGVSAAFVGETVRAVSDVLHEAVAATVESGGNPAMAFAAMSTEYNPMDAGGSTGLHPDGLGGEAGVHPDGLGGATHPEGLGGNGETLNTQSVTITEHTKINLPNDYKMEGSSVGHVTVTGPDGQPFAVDANGDGTLTQESIDNLQNHGLNVTQSTDTIQGPPQVSHETVTANEFVQNHQDDMKTFKVVSFMDNDTKAPDLNELGDQHQVLPDGSIRISVDSMTSGGSFHNGEHIDLHEAAKSGKLVATVSVGHGSQAHAFEIPFDKSGHAIIDKDSPAHALYDAKGNFHGGFERVGVLDGQNPDGSYRIISLATVVGSNSEHFQDTISTPTYADIHTYTLTPNATPSSFNPSVGTASTSTPTHDIPPIVPIPIFGTKFGKANSKTSAPTPTPPPGPTPGNPNGSPAPTPPPPGPTPGPTPPPPGPGPTNPNNTGPGSGNKTTGGPSPNKGPQPNPGGPGANTGNAGSHSSGNKTKQGSTNQKTGPNGRSSTGKPSGQGNNNGNGNNGSNGHNQGRQTGNGQNNQQNANNGQQSKPNTGGNRTPGQVILDQVNAESRPMPDAIGIDMSDLSPRERKMVIRLAHETMDRIQRQPGERYDTWQMRVIIGMQDTADLIEANLPNVPGEVRHLFETAARKMYQAKPRIKQTTP